MKRAFTIIELIFVIVVLGILAAVALPKFSQALTQADLSQAKSRVTSIRSAIVVYKNKHILLGENPYPDTLSSDDDHLFDKILPNAIQPSSKNGGWKRISQNPEKYKFHIPNGFIVFAYDKAKGTFSCDPDASSSAKLCDQF